MLTALSSILSGRMVHQSLALLCEPVPDFLVPAQYARSNSGETSNVFFCYRVETRELRRPPPKQGQQPPALRATYTPHPRPNVVIQPLGRQAHGREPGRVRRFLRLSQTEPALWILTESRRQNFKFSKGKTSAGTWVTRVVSKGGDDLRAHHSWVIFAWLITVPFFGIRVCANSRKMPP